jgi:hypothetical protein
MTPAHGHQTMIRSSVKTGVAQANIITNVSGEAPQARPDFKIRPGDTGNRGEADAAQSAPTLDELPG